MLGVSCEVLMKRAVQNKPTILDEIVLAMHGANECATRMHELDEQIRDNLEDFGAHLRKLLEFPKLFQAPEAERLLWRIERLRELRNMSEYGSLKIVVNRDMDAIWQRVPK
jgi:hypothetical protein